MLTLIWSKMDNRKLTDDTDRHLASVGYWHQLICLLLIKCLQQNTPGNAWFELSLKAKN